MRRDRRAVAFALFAVAAPGCNACSPRPHVGGKPDAGPAVVVVERKPPPPAPRPAPGRPAREAVALVPEQEPDDELGRAQPIEFPKGIQGMIATDGDAVRPGKADTDFYQWLVGGDAAKQVARVELAAINAGAMSLEALDGDGRPLVAAELASQGELLVIPNLAVEIGKTYYFRVRARAAAKQGAAAIVPRPGSAGAGELAYSLVVRAAPLEPGEEEEPNDSRARATPLLAGVDATGWFGHAHDEDWLKLPADLPASGSTLRFELAVPDGVAATLRVRDAAGAILAEARGGKGGELRLRNTPMAPGGALVLRADTGHSVDDRWRLRIGAEATIPGVEAEPNNAPAAATPIEVGSGGQTAGYLWPGDVDVFRVKPGAPGTLRVEAAPPPGVDVRLERLGDSGNAVEKTDAAGPGKPERIDGIELAGRDILIRLSARPHDTAFDAPYMLRWYFTPESAAPPPAAPNGAAASP